MINYYCSCSYSWKHWRTSKISYCYHHHRLFPFLISNSNLLVWNLFCCSKQFGLYSPCSMSWLCASFCSSRMAMYHIIQRELSSAQLHHQTPQRRVKSSQKCSTTAWTRSVRPHPTPGHSCAAMWISTSPTKGEAWTPWSAEQPTSSSWRPTSTPSSSCGPSLTCSDDDDTARLCNTATYQTNSAHYWVLTRQGKLSLHKGCDRQVAL